MEKEAPKTVGEIGNYYGGLAVRKNGNKFEWGIENWDGTNWEEIPEYLYQALIKFEDERP